MEEENKIYWFTNSEEDKKYRTTTWYRCVGLEQFLKLVEEKHKIVGMVSSGNNIGFILDDDLTDDGTDPKGD